MSSEQVVMQISILTGRDKTFILPFLCVYFHFFEFIRSLDPLFHDAAFSTKIHNCCWVFLTALIPIFHRVNTSLPRVFELHDIIAVIAQQPLCSCGGHSLVHKKYHPNFLLHSTKQTQMCWTQNVTSRIFVISMAATLFEFLPNWDNYQALERKNIQQKIAETKAKRLCSKWLTPPINIHKTLVGT